MVAKKLNRIEELRVGDVVAIVGHVRVNYAANDPVGWQVSKCQVVDGQPMVSGNVLVHHVESTGKWPDEKLALDGEYGGPFELTNHGESIGVEYGHCGPDLVEVFLLWRKGEYNDQEEE